MLLIKIGFCLFVVLVILKSLLRGLLYENDLFLDIIVVFLDLFMLFFWVFLFIYWIFLFLEILLFGFFILIDVLLCWILRLLVMNCFFWVWDLFLNRFVVFVMFIVVEKLSFFFFFFWLLFFMVFFRICFFVWCWVCFRGGWMGVWKLFLFFELVWFELWGEINCGVCVDFFVYLRVDL